MSKGWNENMLKKLKSLVGKGLSTSEMGKKLGMSKNAVVGKLNRLGWNAKATEKTDKKAPAKKTVAKKEVAKKVVKKAETKVVKKTTVKPVKKAETTKKVAKKTTVTPKTANKKATPVKKAAAKKVEKIAPKKEVKKAVKPAVKTKSVKEPVEEKPVIKTASKKTKKDLALHELLIQHALQMANLKTNQCRWPIGDPDSDNFHFCGEQVFSGKPYCYEHCRQAYQFTPPKKK